MEANQKGNATQNTTQPQVSSPNPVMAPGSALVQKSALESPQAPSTKTEEPNMMKQGVSAKKKGKGAVLSMILLGILAVGGISFGIWEFYSAGRQKEGLNTQINALKQENNELLDKLNEITDISNSTNTNPTRMEQNPIILSDDPNEEYSFSLDSKVYVESGADNILIRIQDGEITNCSVGRREYMGTNGGYAVTELNDCRVTGLTGKIYKVVEIWAGHMNIDENIGFIMQDGTVQYFNFNNAVANNDYSVKELNIDGFVVDAFNIAVGQVGYSASGYSTTAFVLSDGSIIKYDESML